MVATILKNKNVLNATFIIIETFAKIKELSRNINGIKKTATKYELNLRFVNVNRSSKKIKGDKK